MKIYSKYIKLFKIFSLLIILSSLISNNSYADDTSFFIGKSDAPVKIKVFSSFTCPHCANFHMKIIPEIEISLTSIVI